MSNFEGIGTYFCDDTREIGLDCTGIIRNRGHAKITLVLFDVWCGWCGWCGCLAIDLQTSG